MFQERLDYSGYWFRVHLLRKVNSATLQLINVTALSLFAFHGLTDRSGPGTTRCRGFTITQTHHTR
jgi:hypothetical protein